MILYFLDAPDAQILKNANCVILDTLHIIDYVKHAQLNACSVIAHNALFVKKAIRFLKEDALSVNKKAGCCLMILASHVYPAVANVTLLLHAVSAHTTDILKEASVSAMKVKTESFTLPNGSKATLVTDLA